MKTIERFEKYLSSESVQDMYTFFDNPSHNVFDSALDHTPQKDIYNHNRHMRGFGNELIKAISEKRPVDYDKRDRATKVTRQVMNQHIEQLKVLLQQPQIEANILEFESHDPIPGIFSTSAARELLLVLEHIDEHMYIMQKKHNDSALQEESFFLESDYRFELSVLDSLIHQSEHETEILIIQQFDKLLEDIKHLKFEITPYAQKFEQQVTQLKHLSQFNSNTPINLIKNDRYLSTSVGREIDAMSHHCIHSSAIIKQSVEKYYPEQFESIFEDKKDIGIAPSTKRYQEANK